MRIMRKRDLMLEIIDKSKRLLFIILIIMIIIVAFLSNWPIKLIEQMVNLASRGSYENIDRICLIGITYLIAQVLRSGLYAGVQYLSEFLQYNIGMDIQIKIYSKLLESQIIDLQEKSSTDITNSLVEDTDYIINNLIEPMAKLVFSIISFIIGFYYMYSINGTLTLIILPLGLITSLIVQRIQLKSSENIQNKRVISSRLWKVFGEGIKGIIPIRLNNFEEKYKLKIDESSRKMKDVCLSQAKLEALSYFSMSSLFMCTIGSIVLISAIFVVRGEVSIGGLTAIMMYNHMLVDPLVEILNVQQNFIKLDVSLKRIISLLSLNTDRMLNVDKVDVDKIEIRNMSFSYSGDKSNIENINLVISNPCRIAIVGHSGAGKSTLVNLISGLYYPTSGEINYYLKGEKQEGLPTISYLVQDGYLFDTTIMDNISIVNKELNQSDINKVIDLCKLESIMVNHQQDTIGENGVFLSGGERKRIRLARTIASDQASIYIFDELTSSLDEALSHNILNRLFERLSDKLCIFIEHDLDVASLMDLIIVMENGKIVEFGTHNELLQKKEVYYRMFLERR